MPTSDAILAWASTVANDWRSFAVVWHVALAILLGALVVGWRPSGRLLGGLLVLPLASVGAVAWASGNPFNGLAFAILVAALVGGWARLSKSNVHRAPVVWFAAGTILMFLGSTYPHFLETDSWATYLYAAPLGLLPCPTLSAVIGVTLMFGALQSVAWTVPLLLAGLLYGVIGVFRLGVVLDYGLLAGAAVLAVALASERQTWRSVPLSDSRLGVGSPSTDGDVGILVLEDRGPGRSVMRPDCASACCEARHDHELLAPLDDPRAGRWLWPRCRSVRPLCRHHLVSLRARARAESG